MIFEVDIKKVIPNKENPRIIKDLKFDDFLKVKINGKIYDGING